MIRRDTAIDELERIRYKLWEIDIPSPTVPEYIEHHEQVQSVMKAVTESVDRIWQEPAQHEIIYCKDCAKHNKGVGYLEVLPDGRNSWIWKDRACPLVNWRGKAQGHEFDYQYCAFAERRTDG